MTEKSEHDAPQHHAYHRRELVKMVRQDTGLSQYVVEQVMNSTFNNIRQILTHGDSITVANFGKWYTKVHNRKRAFLGHKKQAYMIASTRRPLFRASSTLKNEIQEYDDYFEKLKERHLKEAQQDANDDTSTQATDTSHLKPTHDNPNDD